MAEYVTYPLNTDAYYDAADAQVYTATREKGVYANDHFNATVTGVDNSVTIAPGLAWAKPDEWSGVAFASKTPVKVDLPLADPSQPRFDLITIQFNSIREFRGEIDYIQGTPSSNPNYPEISRNNNVFELALYAVRRNVGAVTITAADIVDLRIDEQYCGIMRDGVTGIDTTVIVARVDETLAQLTAQGNATIEALDEALQSVLDRNGLMLKSEYADQPNVVNESLVSQDAQEHISKRDNPHGVTAAQAAALPIGGGTVTGAVTVNGAFRTKAAAVFEQSPDILAAARFGGSSNIQISFSNSVYAMYLLANQVSARRADLSAYAPINASSFNEQSTKKVKENIADITEKQALDLLKLRPVSYSLKNITNTDGELENPNIITLEDGTQWRTSTDTDYGFIAEEVNEIDSAYVRFDENGDPEAIHYSEYIAPLIKLVQMQQAKIEALEKKLEV